MKQQADYRLGTLHVTNLTDPVGYNVGYLTGYGDARKLIKENKKFLQEEIISYINTTYSQLEVVGSISGSTLTVSSVVLGTVTPNSVIRGQGIAVGTTIDQQLTGTTGGVGTYEVSISQTSPSTTIKADTHFSRTKTRRDAGYVIDAVIYDLTYGGNAQSVTAGLAYFDGDNADSTIARAQIPASIKSATLGTLEFLKTRMQSVATGASFTALQTAVPRYTDTVGSAGAATLIGNNVDDIIEIIDAGPGAVGTTVTLVDPVTNTLYITDFAYKARPFNYMVESRNYYFKDKLDFMYKDTQIQYPETLHTSYLTLDTPKGMAESLFQYMKDNEIVPNFIYPQKLVNEFTVSASTYEAMISKQESLKAFLASDY
jgi:hypothetical protein